MAVREQMEWRRIVYIPAWRQPFKAEAELSSGPHRFAMAVLATENMDDVYVSPRELDRASTSYTVDTLEELRAEEPEATIDWIIGDDNLPQLMAWKSVERILEIANFTVLMRSSGEVPSALRSRVCEVTARAAFGCIVLVANATVPVSATEIRRRVRAGESIDGLVHPRVSRYIQHNRLYREVPR